jgi:hypothetical protein
MAATNTEALAQSGRAGIVWIEDREGAIARGLADTVTASGAHVRFTGKPDLEVGDEVALRICLERDAPTVATTARIRSVRTVEGAVECELEWTASAPQRAALDALLLSAA